MPGKKKAYHFLSFEAFRQFSRVYIVILDSITGSDHGSGRQSRDGFQKFLLDLLRQAGRYAVRVNSVVIKAFGFEKNLVPAAIREPHDLIFYRWTVARTAGFNLAAINRRAIEIGPDEIMAGFRGPGNKTGYLGRCYLFRQERKRTGRMIALLLGQCRPIDGSSIQPGRCPGFKPPQRKTKFRKGIRKPRARRLAITTGGTCLFANMNEAPQECTRCQDNRAATDFLAGLGYDAGNLPIFDDEIAHRRATDCQTLLFRKHRLHRLAIKLAIRLGAWPAHCGALARIQHAKLDAGRIRDLSHHPVKRIDFPDHVALCQSPYSRVARHFTNRLKAMGQQERFCAHARGCRRGFATGVPAPDYYDVEIAHARSFILSGYRNEAIPAPRPGMFHVKHFIFRYRTRRTTGPEHLPHRPAR